MIATTIDFQAAVLEADYANTEFLHIWLDGRNHLNSPQVRSIRDYRDTAGQVVEDMIAANIAAITDSTPEA